VPKLKCKRCISCTEIETPDVQEKVGIKIMEKALIEKLAKKNILVIDDDGLITRTLCSLLKFQRGQTPTGKIRLINIIT